MDIYEKIKKLRKQQKMSQEELAEKVGYTDRSSIAKVEAGKVNLPYDKMNKFADALGVSPYELMGWNANSEQYSEDDAFGQLMANLKLSKEQKMQVEFFARYLLESNTNN